MNISIKTNHGSIYLELFPDKAPITVENFLFYIEDEFFNGIIFHRVINDFMIQSGSWSPDLVFNYPRENIINEANNGLKNLRGTIGMARDVEPHTANSQFYINQKDNPHSDYQNQDHYGYCVFGKVINGMDVVDSIANVQVKDFKKSDLFLESLPIEPVIIENMLVYYKNY